MHASTTGDAVYVVVFKDGVNARAKASKAGVHPTYVYSNALSGFSATLSAKQRHRLTTDPQTLMVTLADRGLAAPTAEATVTPIEQIVPQVVSRGIKRVGALSSPTADIDGRDDRVHVDVAVLDSGIDPAQPDLNVVGGTSCTANDAGYEDVLGHGTMVAGVIGALDNSFGVVGVAPGVRLWSVRVLDATDSTSDAELLCGLDWVMKHHNRIDVANMSLGDRGTDDRHCGLGNHDPVHWAICHVVDKGGVTAIAAAGNDSINTSRFIPAAYSEVITVSGMADSDGAPGGKGGPTTCLGDADDTFAFFSNYGAAVDLAAPAECVGTTYLGGDVALDSGTSFAAPHVSGGAALYIATHPKATPRQVRAALIRHRERIALPGDPDGSNEGVLNVSGF